MAPRSPQKGVVLVTILVIMALCVTVIVAMTLASERAIRTTAGDLDAAQARALLAAGEASALSALLLDLQNPPEADGPSEPWATLAQSDTAITGGRFELQIWDEAARFNLNTLTEASPWARQSLAAIVKAAALPPEVATRIAAALKGGTPLLQTADLGPRAGLSLPEIAALDAFVTLTPDLNGGVNVNTAPPELLTALLSNPDTVTRLVNARRDRLITPAVLQELGVILPAGLTVKSTVFGLRTAVTSGSARLTALSTLHRWRDAGGRSHAVISARKLVQP